MHDFINVSVSILLVELIKLTDFIQYTHSVVSTEIKSLKFCYILLQIFNPETKNSSSVRFVVIIIIIIIKIVHEVQNKTHKSNKSKSKRNTLGYSVQTDLINVSISSLVNMLFILSKHHRVLYHIYFSLQTSRYIQQMIVGSNHLMYR